MRMAARSPAAKPDSSSAAASGMRRIANSPIGEPAALALAVGFDQAEFRRPALAWRPSALRQGIRIA